MCNSAPKAKFLAALSLAFTFGLSLAVSPAQADENGWIDGEQEVVRERPRRPRSQAPDSGNYGGNQPNFVDQSQGRRDYDDGGDDGGSTRRSQPDQSAGNTNPVLTIKAGSNTISGGISSSTFRNSSRSYRGLDKMSTRFLQQAPFLDLPQTIAVQPSTFKNWLEQYHTGALAAFSRTTIIEIKGQWDDSGHILRSFGLPFTRIPPSKVGDTDLSGTKILVVNCGANLNADALKKVRKFVQDGGYLLTTDWALDSCLEKAFPGYVEWNSDYTENSVVDAVVVDDDPVLLVGMPRVAYWKLENRSQTVKVLRGREVQVLARSRTLMQRECSNLGILALTFSFGAGRVLHLVGHFDNNADRAFNNALPDPSPVIGISLRQAIAGNFVVAALKGDMKEEGEAQPAESNDTQ